MQQHLLTIKLKFNTRVTESWTHWLYELYSACKRSSILYGKFSLITVLWRK